MPFYWFNLRAESGVHEDAVGQELPTDTAALEETVIAARELVLQRVRRGEAVGNDAYEVCTEAGDLVHRVTLRSVIR